MVPLQERLVGGHKYSSSYLSGSRNDTICRVAMQIELGGCDADLAINGKFNQSKAQQDHAAILQAAVTW